MKALKLLFFSALILSATVLSAQAEPTYGCNDPDAFNYVAGGFDVNSNCKYEGDSCDDGDAATFASHYNSSGNCIETILGCMDESACNYNSAATEPQTCIYPFTQDTASFGGNGAGCWICNQTIGLAPHGDGKGILEGNDINSNGVCDDEEVIGCMDATACNFNENATAESLFSDGVSNCLFAEGCDYCGIPQTDGTVTFISEGGVDLPTHPDYVVVNGDANGNGVCDDIDVYGCLDPVACTYDVLATIDTSFYNPLCVPPGDCGCDGVLPVDVPDGDCGCNSAKTDSIGQCLPESDPLFCNLDDNDNGICDVLEVIGCMNAEFCNYDEDANVEGDCAMLDECGVCDGSGSPVGFCDCDGLLADVNNNGICDTEDVYGCTDTESCSYNPLATFLVEEDCLVLDECNVCGGGGSIGPTHCNCAGDKLDAVGVCGGNCAADIDGDGICDNVDPCLVAGESLDECGVCGGPGAIYECGCEPLKETACDCDSTTGEQNYPEPGKDCDGVCMHGFNEDGGCIIASVAQLTIQPEVTQRRMSGNSVITEQNPFQLERWMANVDTLHSRMSKNLDDGSLLGSSDSLTIEKQILNKGNMFVIGESVLSGVVRTDSNLNVMGNLFVQGTATIEGTTFANGGLETKELGVAGRLIVGGKTRLDSMLDVRENTYLHDSLMVENAIVLGRRNGVKMHSDVEGYGWIESDQGYFREDLSAGHDASVANDLTVGGNAKFGDQLTVKPAGVSINAPLTLNGDQDVTGDVSTTGSATIGSAATVGANLTVDGNLFQKGLSFSSYASSFQIGKEATNLQIQHYSVLNGSTYGPVDKYGLIVDGKGNGNTNGIAIRVDKSDPGITSDFVTFIDKDGKVVGAIEGVRADEVFTDPYYFDMVAHDAGDFLTLKDINALATREVVVAVKKVAEEGGKGVSATVPSVGFTSSDVAEGVSHGVVAGFDVASTTAAVITSAMATFNLVKAGALHAAGQAAYFSIKRGVAYKSGGADYAEWIEKENHRLDFMPGEIVGVRGGKVSSNTDHADHVLVVSTSPIVLGNEPERGEEVNFEKIAFMGQIPIRIHGSVQKGDFILPSGDNNGLGYAVSPEEIELNQIPHILAVAWEEGSNSFFNIVNCSIGLDNSGLQELVAQVEESLDAIENRVMDKLDLRLSELGMSGQAFNDRKGSKRRRFWKKPHQGDLIAEKQDGNRGSISKNVQPMLESGMSPTLMVDAPEITDEELGQGINVFAVSVEEAVSKISAVVKSGGDLSQGIHEALGYGRAPVDVVKADARMTCAVFDYFVNENRLVPIMGSVIADEMKKDPEGMEIFLKYFPTGSNAEKQLVQNWMNDLEQQLYEVYPAVGLYGRGRVK